MILEKKKLNANPKEYLKIIALFNEKILLVIEEHTRRVYIHDDDIAYFILEV